VTVSYAVAMDTARRLAGIHDRDQVVVLHNVSWAQYMALDRARGEDVGSPRMAYLDGELELMTTGRRHEIDKTLLARLVECFAEEAEIELVGMGSTTFRKKAKRAGLEPDECYCIGHVGDVPDLAIEVVQTSGGVDKLEIYRRLDVAEVWFFVAEQCEIYRKWGDGYQRRARSVAVRGIDLDEIARIVIDSIDAQQTSVVRKYRRALRKRLG
jgi:Uma2 family endonuclease